MSFLPDRTVRHLRAVLDEPDLSGTRYELRGLLARGGMGVVHRVFDTELQREVALKVLADPEPEPELAERLVREARIIAQLEHPGIVPVYDAGRLADGRVYYAMKLVHGARLDEHLRTAPDLRARLRIVERLCEPVAFAHAHGVIHRDLKPQNVMVGAFGEVLVLDWGVAKRLHRQDAPAEDAPRRLAPASNAPRSEAGTSTPADTGLTEHGTVLGTPGYMAPEQAAGAVGALDARADVYALGALLHFVLSGAVPDPASGALRLPPGVPRPLAAVCARALATRPEDRYPDAAALGAELSRFLAGEAVTACPETLPERVRRVAWRYRAALLLVGAYLVVRLALIFFQQR